MVFDKNDDRSVLVEQIRSLHEYNRTQAAEIAELKNAELHLKLELQKRQDQIERIWKSPTWRTGRVVLSPALILRAAIRKIRRES
jgi:hypothetical protein